LRWIEEKQYNNSVVERLRDVQSILQARMKQIEEHALKDGETLADIDASYKSRMTGTSDVGAFPTRPRVADPLHVLPLEKRTSFDLLDEAEDLMGKYARARVISDDEL